MIDRVMKSSLTRRRLLLGGSALGAAALSCAPARAAPPPLVSGSGGQFVELDPREDVSHVELTDLAGRRHALARFRGQPVLVAFWASWCPPCIQELPILHRLQQRRDTGFAVVPVSIDSDTALAQRFIRRLGLAGFQSYHDAEGTVASGPRSAVQTTFQLYGMPMSYILDPQGRAAGYIAGAMDWSTLGASQLMAYYRNER